MAIHIQDFAGKEQFQSILCNWAKGTGLEAMVQSVDGKTVYYADGEEREPGKADALDRRSQEFGSSSIQCELQYDGEKVASLYLKEDKDGDRDRQEAALKLLCLTLEEFVKAESSVGRFEEFANRLSAGITETQSLVRNQKEHQRLKEHSEQTEDSCFKCKYRGGKSRRTRQGLRCGSR